MKGMYAKQLLQRNFQTFDFEGVWKKAMGTPEKNGIWLIYGAEKNGKTWFALKLAEYLSQFEKVIYLSAEQGIGKTFNDSLTRAKININSRKIIYYPYTPVAEVEQRLKKRQSPKVVFFDNMTFYEDELKYGELRRLKMEHPNKLLVFIVHEENGAPEKATGKLCKKLADIIVRVKGLACEVSGRCPGGTLTIDEEKAQLYHGTEILNDNQ